jgi:hypothetical protein
VAKPNSSAQTLGTLDRLALVHAELFLVSSSQASHDRGTDNEHKDRDK